MERKWMFLLAGLVGCCLFAPGTALMAQETRTVMTASYYLRGSLEQVKGVVMTDRGPVEVAFNGTVGFKLRRTAKSGFDVSLDRLSLIAKGIPTAKGNSGLIGLSLASPGYAVKYDRKSGQVSAAFRSVLHYELIDKVKGFRQTGRAKGEMDNFVPYTEIMAGTLRGRLPANLKPAEQGTLRFDGEAAMELRSSALGAIRNLKVKFPGSILEWLKSPAELLKIQPVFVGAGAADPDATGKAYETLKNRAAEVFGKCGTVRCLKLVFNEPVYVDNDSYRVLDDSAEAINFKSEVNVDDAIEVFFAERMSTSLTCSWGGGATYSSGTASAKIVTSDQQLSVPCPCPASCATYCPLGPCTCGALNNYHLAHELGHVVNLAHPGDSGLAASTANSVMEPSGFCNDNPGTQSAKNCRNSANPLLYWGKALCFGSPDIMD